LAAAGLVHLPREGPFLVSGGLADGLWGLLRVIGRGRVLDLVREPLRD
jgi:hypothetical protein